MSDRLFDLPSPAAHATWQQQSNLRKYSGVNESDVRRTPRALFDALNGEFGPFDVDVAALPDNALCPLFFTPDDNGLTQCWAPSRCWMNPPYSNIPPWTQKAVREAQQGALIVGLLPVRTDLGWFHRDILPFAEVRFVRGRIWFGGIPGKAPFPSMIVVWRPQPRPM